MAILIDPPAWPAHGTLWSHLVSDHSYDELHTFAARLNLPRRGFDLDHYDVPASLYERAIAFGARPVTGKDVARQLRASGLRVRQADREAVTPVRRREYLSGEWSRLGELVGIPGTGHAGREWQALGDDLLGRWNEPHRSYHDERHLEDVLLALDQLATRGERLAPATLLAAWFHDAVYDGSPSDELDSAALAVDALGRLGLSPSVVTAVGDYIVATIPAIEVTNHAAPLAHLLDADLSIFAAGPERYERYALAVRAEYAHVSAADFASGRASILSGYLARPTIYRTDAAQQLWERRARRNVEDEIARLLHSIPNDGESASP
ncbi:DUF4031 domain-containing protein [Lysinibacter cavernae]|uniref:Putative metal-dependent HD superfamily phosphohydrolase n=1 Tax=Lysinibacter cavernae TaxID=1640652 RepID=A0A7X5QYA0_9MICO|nr:DUF4031 domain-containing protein [Lysinibacter cavernae]NIH52143.1 putative metal-dependent HD superfamily phosphohydrolase [Lysinibacter cavernae]